MPKPGFAPKIAFAASVGSFIEWFDFFIATTAAVVVWPALFFPSSSPGVSLIFALTSVLAAKAAAPVGAAIFGHYGDRKGRRAGVTWSLVLTGLASLGVALTPGYATLGILSAVLIFVLRILSGIGFGGDYGPSVTWVTEASHASRWRGFWGSWVGSAIQLGTIASSLSFSVASSVLPQAAFLQWGWRVIFVLGSLAALVGIIVRLRSAESPLYEDLKAKGGVEMSPLVATAKRNWKKILVLTIPWGAIYGVGNMVGQVGGQAYLKALHVPIPLITFSVAMAATFALFMGTGLAVLSDVFPRGRKWIIIILMGAVALSSTFTFRLYQSGTPFGVVAGMISVFGLTSSTSQIFPAFLTDQFGTSIRTSGTGLVAEIGSLISGLFTSPIIPILISLNGGLIIASVSGFVAVAIVSMIVGISLLLLFKENRPSDLNSPAG
ncbi:MAG: MFS transporter [Nitrososphaerota archaeon]|nr:MFS transporter [Nitrososphaerota archaeon]